ncbi:MAG: hypothetical protein ACREDU_06430 [Methylocella sp.]
MSQFKSVVLLLIVVSLSLIWFAISGPHDRVREKGNSQDDSNANARAPLHAPELPHPSTARKTVTDKSDSLGVVGGSLSNEKTENDPEAALVSLKAGLLTVALEEQPLRWVLDEISRQSGMMLETSPEIGDERVTDAFQDLPIERGLRRLLGSWDLFFFYAGDEPGPRYVWVYPKGKGAALRPIPPEVWASTRELEEAFNDTDPEVRPGRSWHWSSARANRRWRCCSRPWTTRMIKSAAEP